MPQNAPLFSGSLRQNLDPFETCSDEHIWWAMRECHVDGVVMAAVVAMRRHNMSSSEKKDNREQVETSDQSTRTKGKYYHSNRQAPRSATVGSEASTSAGDAGPSHYSDWAENERDSSPYNRDRRRSLRTMDTETDSPGNLVSIIVKLIEMSLAYRDIHSFMFYC